MQAGHGQRVFSWTPAKLVGLFQMLSPETKTRGYNACHAAVLLGLVFPTCAVCALSPVGLYRLAGDHAVPFVFYLGTVTNFLFAAYKMATIARRSGDLRLCLEVSRPDFTSYRRYDPAVFRRWRARAARISWAMLVAYTLPSGFFSVSPYVFGAAAGDGGRVHVAARDRDGTRAEYRMNIYNVYVPVPDAATYNRFFNVFYVIELIPHVLYSFSTTAFDLSVVMMCLSICCQLERIRIAIEALGHGDAFSSVDDRGGPRVRPIGDGFVLSTNINKKTKLSEKIDIFDDLQCIIVDHQKVLKKIVDYYYIMKPVMLTQIFVASSSHVFVWFICAMAVFESELSNSILLMKLCLALPVFTFQWFMTCYLFGSINEHKNSINFALYSSNWTEMSVKSRKLVFLVMSMNNVNHLQMRFTNIQIVNLEMFTKTMRFCYSMFSMLINYNKNQIH